jgi:predicted nucleic acid-binding protein
MIVLVRYPLKKIKTMVNKRFTIDTNILVYSVDINAGSKHEISAQIIDRAMFADCILTVQALAEFFAAATRKKYATANQASGFINEWLNIFPVAGTSAHVLTKAISAVSEHQLSFWDAMIWATAKEAGCSILLSEDFQDGHKLDGVHFCNPFSEFKSPVLKEQKSFVEKFFA